MENTLVTSFRIRSRRVPIGLLIVASLFLFNQCGPDEKKLEEKYNKAQGLFWANKRVEAAKLLKEVYDAKPDYKDVSFTLGRAYYFDMKFQDALKCFTEAYDKDRENLTPLLWIIKTQFAAGIRDKSLFDNIQSFAKRDAGNIELLFMNGRLLEESGKTDQAIQSYNQVVLQTLPLALAHKRLAEIYKKANITQKANFHQRKFENLTSKE
ncbi:tetratricopeptide repeat protein [Leptospira fainei]|uniref:tetratricopeptide repeat protein n=1 Tax=Leptospira fainei TaxID=48782 RepID=UPI0012EB1436|nr:tetratricopeptide repeat protein [Leptospira fainei]